MAIFQAVVTIDSPTLGGRGVNIWHGRTGGDLEDGESVANNLMVELHQFYEDIKVAFNGATRFSFDGEIREVGVADPQVLDTLDSWAVVGGTTTPDLPPANCLVVSWRTTSASRSGRGRTFLGPISQDAAEDNGTPVEAVRTTIGTACQTLIGSFAGAGDAALGVYSPKQNLLRDFRSGSVANQFGVLRSRRD